MLAGDHRLRGRNVVKVYFTAAFSLPRNSSWRRSQVSPKFGDCGECLSVSFPSSSCFLYSPKLLDDVRRQQPGQKHFLPTCIFVRTQSESSRSRLHSDWTVECFQWEMWAHSLKCFLLKSSVDFVNTQVYLSPHAKGNWKWSHQSLRIRQEWDHWIWALRVWKWGKCFKQHECSYQRLIPNLISNTFKLWAYGESRVGPKVLEIGGLECSHA